MGFQTLALLDDTSFWIWSDYTMTFESVATLAAIRYTLIVHTVYTESNFSLNFAKFL